MSDDLADIDRWTTVKAIAAHVQKTERTITRAIKLGILRASKTRGIRGHRVKLKNANEFIRRAYPEKEAMR